MRDLVNFVISSPLALGIIIAGLVVLGLYGNRRRRRERREDIRRGIEEARPR